MRLGSGIFILGKQLPVIAERAEQHLLAAAVIGDLVASSMHSGAIADCGAIGRANPIDLDQHGCHAPCDH
ncbi:hypothetical protein POPTR_006G062050v4 [Populus trichocarpa]|uniref:Uncharacterized protein n=1 Tax=Populus trichocarpa TaxID=3694 RepID=A0A3N7F2V5_POPTR|nr:hypothetical protein BDE02_06G052700 [Populus trichocarpa]RQO91329.1 hypothetical protein POPTR_006G062050v4 [Populus trichocarpa]